MDKVKFNLYNVHYSVLTETVGTGGEINYSYGTPVPWPGAVSITADPAGESSPFYADGIVYYISEANNGYEGEFESALVPDSVLTDVYGMELNSADKVITESANAEAKSIALMFRVDTDKASRDCIFYKCKLGRPNVGASTNSGTKEPQTQSVSLTISPRADFKVKACTTDNTPASVKNGWYTAVYDAPAASGADITAFIINGVAGEISGNNITVNLPHGTAVSSLSPTIALSAGATVSPTSGTSKSFTSPQTYTVTAADSTTTKTYTVTVNVAAE